MVTASKGIRAANSHRSNELLLVYETLIKTRKLRTSFPQNTEKSTRRPPGRQISTSFISLVVNDVSIARLSSSPVIKSRR